MNRICDALRFPLAGVFLWAGIAKLIDPAAFADGVADFRFFPDTMVNVIAICVPMVEIAAAALLLSGRWSRPGALLSIFLTMSFTVLFGWAAVQGREVECSCFGGGEFLGATVTAGLIRAVILLGVSILIYVGRLQYTRQLHPEVGIEDHPAVRTGRRREM